MTLVKQHGLKLKKPELDHWVMGSGKATARFGAGDLKPDGDWSKHDPLRELQRRNGLETYNCTNFGTGNALLALASFLGYKDFVKNISERYTGVMTGTTKSGNDPHHVIERIRSFCGLIPEDRLPWTTESTFQTYYAPNPMDETLVAEGQKILKQFVIGQEWVFPYGTRLTPEKKQDKIKEALRRAPVCVSVRAWNKEGNVYTKAVGAQDTHWVWLMKYDKNGYPIIRDQYIPFEKRLAKNYDFNASKMYFLSRNESGISPVQMDYFAWLMRLTMKAYRVLFPLPVEIKPIPDPKPLPTPKPKPVPMTNREKLYEKSKSLLKTKQVSAGVPISLGCASALNNVFKAQFGTFIGGGAATAGMFNVLKTDPRFEEIAEKDVLPGDIVMNATGTSTRGYKNGHVGIHGFTETMSNNSANGLWSAHYTNEAWKAFFEVKKGFKTRYFRVRG